jgi:hypothetical protein
MNCVVSLVIKGKSEPVKGLTSTVKHLKTQTGLEITFEKKDRASLDFFSSLTEDIMVLGLTEAPIGPLTFIVGDAPAIGRLHNRARKSMVRMLIQSEEIEWDTASGVLEFTVENGIGADLPPLVEIITRLIFRSTMKTSHTRHDLTLFDLKQTCGLIQDSKDGLDGVDDVLAWMNTRELVTAEKEKEEKAVAAKARREAKAKAAKAKKEAAALVEAKEEKEEAVADKAKVKAAKAKAAKGKAKAAKGKATPKAAETADLAPEVDPQ